MNSTFRHSHQLAPVLLIILTIACSDSEMPVQVQDLPDNPATIMGPQAVQVHDFDDEMERLALEEMPGFAGHYLDSAGNSVVLVARGGRAGAAAELGAMLRRRHGLAAAPIVVREVSHDFAKLRDWQRALTGAVPAYRIRMIDIDEVANKIHFGVADDVALQELREAAERRGVPENALRLEVIEAPVTRATLLDQSTYAFGALRITNEQIGQFGGCTLGFTYVLPGTELSFPHFVTASHCSPTQYGLDHSYQRQPDLAGPRIGREVKDPALYRCTFFVSQCRYSDAAHYAILNEVGWGLGIIVRVVGPPGTTADGSITIDSISPQFKITQKWSSSSAAPGGTRIDKVGSTSGWTTGAVTQTCVHFPGSSLRCQWVTSTRSRPGDSGSAMFHPTSLPNSTVALHGIMWGGPCNHMDSCFNTTYYSTIWNIEHDVNTVMQVCYAGFNC